MEISKLSIDALTIIGANLVLVLMGLGTTVTLFIWARSEARQDRQNEAERAQKNREETNAIIKSIHEEIKDFHMRLYSIEERTRTKIL